MRNKMMLVILYVVIATNYSCNKCKNPTYVPRAKLMNEYFGNYKLGAYWIYLNRDSTKRDSVWVDNFKNEIEKDNISCITSNETFFDMHCTYLDTTMKLSVKLGFNGDDINVNTITMENKGGDVYGGLYSNSTVDTFYSIGTPGQVQQLYNYQLWENNPNTTFPVVTRWGRFIIASNLCIVQYIPLNTEDTFSLIKHFIP